MSDSDGRTPERGDQHRLPDGTREVVFQVAEGRVLTVREYPSARAYRDGVASGEYLGTHEGVTDLPDPSAFAPDTDRSDG